MPAATLPSLGRAGSRLAAGPHHTVPLRARGLWLWVTVTHPEALLYLLLHLYAC